MIRHRLNFYLDFVSTLTALALAFTGFLLFFVLPPGTGGRHGGAALSLWGWTRHDYGDIHLCLALIFVALAVVHVWLHWTWVCSTFACFVGGNKPAEGRRKAYGVGTGAVIALGMVFALLCASSEVREIAGESREEDAGLDLGQCEISELESSSTAILDRTLWANEEQLTGPASHRQREIAPSAFLHQGDSSAEPCALQKTARPRKREHEEDHARGNIGVTGQTTLAEAARIGGVSAQILRQELGLPGSVDVHERLGRLKRRHGLNIYALRNIVQQHTNTNAQ